MMITRQTIRTILLIVVAIMFLVYFFKVSKELKKCTQPVTATYDGVGRGLGKSFGHVLLFTYDYNGTHYESAESMTNQTIFSFNRDKMNQTMEKLGYEIGKSYTIYVNPDQPQKFISGNYSVTR